MALIRARYRKSLAGLVLILAAAMAWGGTGSCLAHDSECAAAESCCCPSVRDSVCDSKECMCSVRHPAQVSSSGYAISWETLTVARASLSSCLRVPTESAVFVIRLSAYHPRSPDVLRSVILLI